MFFSLSWKMVRQQGLAVPSPGGKAEVAQRCRQGKGWFLWRWLPRDDCRRVVTH